MQSPPSQDIPATVARLRATFRSGRTRDLAWRRQQLLALRKMLVENEESLAEALAADLGKCSLEAYVTEISFLLQEIKVALKGLKSWARPQRVANSLTAQPGHCRIRSEPLGVVLNITTWNYPLHMAGAPLIGALAAGNCVVIKPSELAPATSSIVARLMGEFLDPDAVAVVEGGVPESTALLEQRFDHIFFTGGGAVGRIVMAAAAKQLCPVTLELGGKSPCIVDRSADIKVAARRIAWGKFTNAGQTCVAPDYLLVHREVVQPLVESITRCVQRFYGEDPRESSDFGRIINSRHHRRLCALLDSGTPAFGGTADEEALYIAPTLLQDVALDSPVMEEEIFGPILPVIVVDDLEEAVGIIDSRPSPLALYLFAADKRAQDFVLDRTRSGGVCINDTMMHLGVPTLPFGGVGASGMGSYHGRAGFETFSHRRSVLTRGTRVDPAVRYPPYSEDKSRLIRRFV